MENPKSGIAGDSCVGRCAGGGPLRAGRMAALCLGALLAVAGCQKTPKAMDAVWTKTPDPGTNTIDENGFELNPQWFAGTQPDPCSFCPCGDENPSSWENAANCTNQTLHNNSSLECFGHWNWFPVAYTGTVFWGGHSNSWYDDDDYYFDVNRPDLALATATGNSGGVHIEFDSEQTVDNWDDTNTWWDDFHHHYVDDSDAAAHGRIDNKEVFVIGMLGLDKQHGVHAELQPVYAMFVHVQDDASQDKWAFFVKNWGNEGYCGDNDEPLEWATQNVYRVRLRHAVGTGFNLGQNVWVYGDDDSERNAQRWDFGTDGSGLILTFHMRDPSKQCGFVGDLTINWGAASAVQGPPRSGAAAGAVGAGAARASASHHFDEDGDPALKAKIDRLSPEDRRLLAEEIAKLKHHPKPQPSQGIPSTAASTPPPKPSGPYPNFGKANWGLPNPARRAERDRRHEAVLEFLRAHGAA